MIAVDIDREYISAPVTLRAYLTQSVGDLKDAVAAKLQMPLETMRLVLEKYYNELKLLKDDARTLKAEGFFKSNKVSA